MVIDTSALVAILGREPERRAFIEAIEAADARLMSVATFVEISIVIEARHGAEGLRFRRGRPCSSKGTTSFIPTSRGWIWVRGDPARLDGEAARWRFTEGRSSRKSDGR